MIDISNTLCGAMVDKHENVDGDRGDFGACASDGSVSMRKIFWGGALAKGRPEVAMEAARRITVRHVVEDTFSLSKESTVDDTVRSDGVDGTYAEIFCLTHRRR